MTLGDLYPDVRREDRLGRWRGKGNGSEVMEVWKGRIR